MGKTDIQAPPARGRRTVQELTRPEVPRPWAVVIWDDPVTTKDFVVELLVAVFRHGDEDAHLKMLEVHLGGKTAAGRYSLEIAETKAAMAETMARAGGYPLRVTCEPTMSA